MNWLLQNIPFEIWITVAGAALFAVYRFFGLRNTVGAAFGMLVVLANIKGRQTGWDNREKKGREDASTAIDKADSARANADRANANSDGLREDDGFKRR